MPSQVAGNLVLDIVRVLTPAGAPLTGMVRATSAGDGSGADVKIWLKRQSGSAAVDATELISWTEVGTSGDYYITFTPQNTGLYWMYLSFVDPAALPSQRDMRYDIIAAGATFAPSYADAFCAETDLERWLQQQIDSTTQPNDTQAAGFATGKADVLESLCAGLGDAVTPATVTAGSRLEGLLREANAVGAALDYTIAQSFMRGASKTDRIDVLLNTWESFVGRYVAGEFIPGSIQMEIQNTASLATNHTLSGDTIARDNSNPPQDVGSQITMGDVF